MRELNQSELHTVSGGSPVYFIGLGQYMADMLYPALFTVVLASLTLGLGFGIYEEISIGQVNH